MKNDYTWVLIELNKMETPRKSIHSFGSVTSLRDSKLMKDGNGDPMTVDQLRSRIKKCKTKDLWQNDQYILIKKDVNKSKRYKNKKK